MAHSLELRVPFMDHILVEHCAAIAPGRKVSRERIKPLLVDAIGFPSIEAASRRKKQGFTFPFSIWMKHSAGVLEEQALSMTVLDRAAVKQCWQDFRENKAHWSRAWMTVVLARCMADS